MKMGECGRMRIRVRVKREKNWEIRQILAIKLRILIGLLGIRDGKKFLFTF